MDEQDIVARLSRALDTQSVALTDEGTSTHEMLNKLSEQINEMGDEATGDGVSQTVRQWPPCLRRHPVVTVPSTK